jgi:branched-chain amino acid transport system permease protein
MGRSLRLPLLWAVSAVTLLSLPLVLSTGMIFKIGLIMIFFVAALGLHALVNWAGELSLAHGTLVGLSCLVVAAVSANTRVNALILVPLGLAVGAACGLLMALVAARAKGFYVAIVTLAVGVVITSYFFKQQWLVGSGTVMANTSPIGPLRLSTPTQLYPILTIVTLLCALIFAALARSKYRRALVVIKSSQQVAEAQGIPVRWYRAGAYVLAGAMAGLAGGLTSVWSGAVSASAFPAQLSFTYLIAVVLAGPGSLIALAQVVVLLQGFAVFVSTSNLILLVIGPLGFILTLTKYPGGLSEQNRLIHRSARRWFRRHRPKRDKPQVTTTSTALADLTSSRKEVVDERSPS